MKPIVPKGWCPSLYAPMQSGDGILVRVKPPGAVLTAQAAHCLAAAASCHGNGIIELTSRAVIQIRGLSPDGLAPFTAAMVEAGLADSDRTVEIRRAVIVAPLSDTAVRAIAAQIEDRVAHDPQLGPLPAKFAVAVEGDNGLSLGDIGATILVVRIGAVWSVTDRPRGETRHVSATDVANTVAAFASLSLRNPVRVPAAPRTQQALGFLPRRMGVPGAFAAGLRFGATTASALAALADLAVRFGDGTLHVTPRRSLIISSVSPTTAELHNACAALGFMVDATDPALRIYACPGQPTCASATVPACSDAERLATLALPVTLHVSGCAKGCAHAGPAPVTLVGDNGLYGIVQNGTARDVPTHRNLTLSEAMAVLCA